MIEIKSRWKSVTNRNKLAARGASFLAKAKATKLIWFPPKPEQVGNKTAATATQATKSTTEKTTGAATKTTDSTKKLSNPGAPDIDTQHPGR
ncbi:MAG TPA: hypothetical protein VE441_02475 [Mycobacterium sp.]|jgi:hypothetical protein|nr:hypothetical protein [Mycobacterium sp.]